MQLYSLALAEALSKNCTIDLHREIASRAFTQALEKIITDRVSLCFLYLMTRMAAYIGFVLLGMLIDHT